MLFNADDLLKLIKRSAIEAVNASKPADMIFGKVISTSPLKIQIEQKLVLTSAQLVLCRNVTNYSVSMTVDFDTEDASDDLHKHNIKGTKTFTIHNALRIGEQVVLMQMSGGQKYIVIDRIGKG